MKVKLTEAQLRSLLRERIARRLLMEESPPPEEPQQGGSGIGFGELAGAFASSALGGIVGKGPVVNQYTKFGKEKSKNQTAVEAIGQLTGAPTPIGLYGARFGPGAGDAINTWQAQYEGWMTQSIKFVSPDPLQDWKNNHARFRTMSGFDLETGNVDRNTKIELPDDARGLLAYLLLVKEGATGEVAIAAAIEKVKEVSRVDSIIDKWVETFSLGNKRVSGDEAISVASDLYQIVSEDKGEGKCFLTRYALGSFAQKNTKYGETAVAKIFDLGLLALSIAEAPATLAGLAGLALGAGMKGARAVGLAASLSDEAAALGTVAATRARVASQMSRQLRTAGETAVAVKRTAAHAAEISKRAAAAEAAVKKAAAAEKALEDTVEAAENARRAKDAIRNADRVDNIALTDIDDELARLKEFLKSDVDADRLEIDDALESVRDLKELKKSKEIIDSAKRAEAALETARDAAKAAKEEAEAAKHLHKRLDPGSPAELAPGDASTAARWAKAAEIGKMVLPTSQVRMVFSTTRDYVAATGIRGLLGVATPIAGVSTMALYLCLGSGWSRSSADKSKLQITGIMAIPEQLSELADEFTNTFFGNYYVANGIDKVEDAIYEFAGKCEDLETLTANDLSILKVALAEGIAQANQVPLGSELERLKTVKDAMGGPGQYLMRGR